MPPVLAASVSFGALLGVLGGISIALSETPHASRSNTSTECESGILDAGMQGMNVLVYEFCADRLTIGFRNSDVVEELTCKPNGGVELWLSTGDPRCHGEFASQQDRVHELLEPLRGAGRATALPVRQLLACRTDRMNRATTTVPDARAALLETRTGDTVYERVTRRFVAECAAPSV